MTADLRVSVDLADLIEIGPIVRAHVFASLSAAVRDVVEEGEARWRAAVAASPLWSGEKDAYAASLSARMTGPYSGEIVSDYRLAQEIESGRPARDLKKMLGWSLKVRVNRRGVRYLIIPFRHNTPGAGRSGMPEHVYAQARGLSASRITGQGWRPSGTGAHDPKTRQVIQVAQRRYVWGGRLGKDAGPRHAGMVRFDARARRGKGAAYSTYLTFRVMSETSRGWVVGPRPGLWIARNVAESLQRTAEQSFGQALRQDLAA